MACKESYFLENVHLIAYLPAGSSPSVVDGPALNVWVAGADLRQALAPLRATLRRLEREGMVALDRCAECEEKYTVSIAMVQADQLAVCLSLTAFSRSFSVVATGRPVLQQPRTHRKQGLPVLLLPQGGLDRRQVRLRGEPAARRTSRRLPALARGQERQGESGGVHRIRLESRTDAVGRHRLRRVHADAVRAVSPGAGEHRQGTAAWHVQHPHGSVQAAAGGALARAGLSARHDQAQLPVRQPSAKEIRHDAGSEHCLALGTISCLLLMCSSTAWRCWRRICSMGY